MATQIRPLLMTGAAFASAAAIVAATPAIMPNVTAPAPLALSAAQAEVQLATFSDLLSITPEDWNYYLFQGWGQAISPNQDPDVDWFAQFLDPFSRCNFNCQVNGPRASPTWLLTRCSTVTATGSTTSTVNWRIQASPINRIPTSPTTTRTSSRRGAFPPSTTSSRPVLVLACSTYSPSRSVIRRVRCTTRTLRA